MPRIDFSPPDITEDDIAAVVSVLKSHWITTSTATKAFEQNLAAWCQTPHVACLNSATAALECALRVLGIGPGDEVVTSAYTYTASASVIVHVGARPVLVDVAPGSYHLDPNALMAAVGPRTRAVISVDIAGLMCDYERIFAVLRQSYAALQGGAAADGAAADGAAADGAAAGGSMAERLARELGRIPVIADAAHSFGATYHGQPSGSLADLSAFSFHAVKNLTTAEGGALTWRPGFAEKIIPLWQEALPQLFGGGGSTGGGGGITAAEAQEGSTPLAEAADDTLYRLLMLFSLHGQSKDAQSKALTGAWEYDIVAPWYKCNMTDMAAALGDSQLRRYAQTLARRQEISALYAQRLLADSEALGYGLDVLAHRSADGRSLSSGHLLLVRLLGQGDAFRRRLIAEMWERGVACNVHYKPLPLLSAYRALGLAASDYPNALAQYENEVTLPLHTLLSDDDVIYVCQCFCESYAVCQQAFGQAAEAEG